jgi:hypothetical protein
VTGVIRRQPAFGIVSMPRGGGTARTRVCMSIRMARLTFASLAFAGIVASAAPQADRALETGRVYSLEGAWYGTVTVTGRGPSASPDTFTSDAQKQGVRGTALCTIPAVGRLPDPSNPAGWLSVTPAAHGNLVRIGTNTYAYSMVRTM